MANDRDRELERLEKELLADLMKEDDLLADIPIELLDTTPVNWDDTQLFSDEELLNLDFDEPEPPAEEVSTPMKQSPKTKRAKAKKREDRWLVTLMAIASFLCLGIIAVLIYWLEVFLK